MLYLVTDPVARQWFETLRPDAHSLHELYAPGRDRAETYEAMVSAILAPVRDGRAVCAAFYGHPGVFVDPSHEAIRRARAEGFDAVMLPGISTEDCLFADLGLDPGATGCVSYEATDFLLRRRPVDPAALLVLWQVGVLGQLDHGQEVDPARFAVLAERLLELYPADHEAILYEASPYPVGEPTIIRTRVGELTAAPPASTLVVPPSELPSVDATVRARLGLAPE